MTIQVQRNRFYVKKPIDIGVNLNPLYKDMSTDTETEFKLGGGIESNYFVVSGTIAQTPDFGDATLVGGSLALFSSNVDMVSNRTMPNLDGYAMSKNVIVKEGGYTFAKRVGETTVVGNRLGVWSSNPQNDNPILYESFEGMPDNFQTVNRMGSNNIVSLSDPYVGYEPLKNMILALDPSYTDEFAEDVILYAYESSNSSRDPRSYATREQRIQALTTNGIGITFADNFSTFTLNGNNTNVNSHSSWLFTRKWSVLKVGSNIQYATVTSAAGNDESAPNATRGNTIFNDIYATRDFSNPYNQDEQDPLLLSTVELSAEKSLNGGQSMRFYHNWSYSAANGTIQNLIANSGNLNPQCARASLYDIPMPSSAFDISQNQSAFDDTTQMYGNLRGTAPEIGIGLNITKLAPNVPLNAQQGNNFLRAISYYQTGTSNGHLAKADLAQQEQTFLRSVVITFSNYKPKPEHTTVDKFLNYGLDRYYSNEQTDNIVGGVIFTRFGIDGVSSDTGVGSNMFAYPIPVTRAAQCSTTVSETLNKGGIARMVGAANLPNLDTLIWGVTNAVDPNADANVRFAELPMNSWVNCRFFTDLQQYNNAGSLANKPYSATTATNPSHGTLSQRGVVMRCIFETEMDNNTTSGSLSNPTTQDLPFIDIPFPAGGATANTGLSNYQIGQETGVYHDYYPKHMTIWVQNYPWVQGGSSEDPAVATRDFNFGDDKPYPSGAAREAEVFIDNVTLKNYGPEVINLNPVTGDGNMVFKPSSHLTPTTSMVSGTKGAPTFMKRGWVRTKQLVDKSILCTYGTSNNFVSIVGGADDQAFTVYDLQNSGVVTVTGAGIPANTTISAWEDSNGDASLITFKLNNTPTTNTSSDLIFNSTGTLEPEFNRAGYEQYNTGYNVCIGYEDRKDLPLGNGSSTADGYTLFNDYYSANQDLVSSGTRLLPLKNAAQGSTTGALISKSGININLGNQLFGSSYYVKGTSGVSSVSGAAFSVSNTEGVNRISVGNSNNNTFVSNDSFSQKGFMRTSVTTDYSTWEKRENIMVSAKVLDIPQRVLADDNPDNNMPLNSLIVSDTSVFDPSNTDCEYRIFLSNMLPSNKYYVDVKLQEDNPIQDNMVRFDKQLYFAQDGITPLFTVKNLTNLYISPKKYWITMMFDTLPTLAPRSYASLCNINETPTSANAAGLLAVSGSTYNEFTYSYNTASLTTQGASGQYERIWDLIPSEANPSLVLDKDFGYGTWDEEKKIGGQLIKGPIYYNQYNYFDIMPLTTAGYGPADNIPILLGLENMGLKNKSVTFRSDNYTIDTAQAPALYWEFEDLPPKVFNLTVRPTVDLLAPRTNLYKLTTENINSVTFDWEEDNADDVWYRMLMVDNTSIADKYHRAIMWVPLNESISDLSGVPTFSVYNKLNNTTSAATVGSSVRSVLEGQAGYAVKLDGSLANANGKVTIPSGANTSGLYNLDEFTVVTHWTPSSDDGGSNRIILTQTNSYTSLNNQFIMQKNSSNNIVVTLDTTIAMTGTTAVPCDGLTPTNIIVTYNSGSSSTTKAKLYINGVLEDTSTGVAVFSSTGRNVVIGGHYVSGYPGTTGIMEEVIIYDRAWDIVPTSNSYIYSTVDTFDFTGIDSSVAGISNYTNSARIFIFDYHNFRGTSQQEIGMSQPIAWRVATA